MVWFFGKTHELSELDNLNRDAEFKRNAVDILCIDDQGLQYEEIIRHHGFNIRVLKDIEDIRSVADYPVVICDIKGIGKAFNSPFEGGHIIQEIKKHYPSKVVIAFSGHQFDAKYNKYFKMSDYVLSKDIDSDQWVDILDETVRKITSPTEQWKRIRQYLVDNNVSTKVIFQLEQEYISAVLDKDASKFGKTKTLNLLSQDVRGVIQGFVASLVFKLVLG
ncbi:response regulator [Vibrio lentus]|uniref:Response regulator n=1 Tax=Vibrio lentus TaxID=136468 RepID=A0A4U2F003_9VIBR|nr:response regulator [Vibrio lentus]TKG07902.1 response regulator [Vibrio lentus]